ncbi:MAG: carboxypeptidase regulatory-like domain-containing protein [bacterium]
MQKRLVMAVILSLFFVLVTGIWVAHYGGCAWAQDMYSLTIDFNGSVTSKDIRVWIQLYEYTQGMTALGMPVAQTLINTCSAYNPPGASTVYLPKGKRYLLRVEPLVGRTSSQGSYQMKEANYQSQFYSKHRTFQEAIADESFIDTTGTANSGTKIIALEAGYKIEGSLKACGAGGSYIEGVMMKLFDANRNPVGRYGKSTGTGGLNSVNYTIYGLSPGKYYLMADGPSKGYIRKFYKGTTGADTIDNAELIQIVNSDATGKNMCLEKGYEVKGTLLDPDGKTMQHTATVYLLDTTYNVAIGAYIFDPNSAAYDEFVTRLNYYLSGGLLDISYRKNDPHFSIGGLDPNYSLGGSPKGALGECILAGMDPRGVYASSFYDGHYFMSEADRIRIKNITPASTFDIRFRKAGRIEGTIKDKAGNPLVQIGIKAIDANDEMNIINIMQPCYTDPNGRYALVGLPPMDYKIEAVDEVNHQYLWQYYQGKSNFIQAQKIQVTEQNLNFSHIDFELEIGGKITGSVKNASTNEAIPGVAVQAFRIGTNSNLTNYPIAQTASGVGITGENGEYMISGLPTGQYVLYARPSYGLNYTAVFYRDSDTLNGADPNIVIAYPSQVLTSYDFLLKKGGVIQGKITGIPPQVRDGLARSIHVDLLDAKTAKLMQSTTEMIDPNTLSYTIMGIPQGEYKIAAVDVRMPPEMLKNYYKENEPKGVSTYKEASIFEINPADGSMQIDFIWDTVGKTISGKVSEDSPEQKPLVNIKIEAYRVEEPSGQLMSTGIYDYTRVSGMYYLKGLAEGTYILKAVDEMNHIYPAEFYSSGFNSFTPDKAERVTLPLTNANALFDFKLNSQIGIIDGVVTKGIAKEYLQGGLVNLYMVGSDQIFQSVLTDPNGHYTFSGLPEGGYKIRAFDPDRNYIPRYYTSGSSLYAFKSAEGETVTVQYSDPLSSKHKNILLDKQGTQIEGKVTISDGSPFAGAIIYLYQVSSGTEWSFVADYYTVNSVEDGKYTVKGLPPGTYKVLAWDYNNNYSPREQEITLSQQGKSGVDLMLTSKYTAVNVPKTTLDLSEGFNLFSFPIRVPLWPSRYNASTLLSDWTATNDPGIVNILHFDTENGKWKNQLSNFLIENGKGYIVYSQSNKKITYSGEIFPGEDDSSVIDLSSGMNIVGNIKSATAGYDSHQMLMNLSNKVYGIRSYDPVTGKWLNSTLLWGKSGGDRFSVFPTKAYIVDMKEPHLSWLP